MTKVPSQDRIEAAKPSEEQIAQWKKQHGQVFEITLNEKCYYLAKPNRPQYKHFIDRLNKSVHDASETLVTDCLLWPSRDEFYLDAKENPALSLTVAASLQDAFGGNEQPVAKNL